MTAPKRFIARIILNFLLVFTAFAIALPNCVVPQNGSTPEHFAWIGVIPPLIISILGTFCIWFIL